MQEDPADFCMRARLAAKVRRRNLAYYPARTAAGKRAVILARIWVKIYQNLPPFGVVSMERAPPPPSLHQHTPSCPPTINPKQHLQWQALTALTRGTHHKRSGYR